MGAIPAVRPAEVAVGIAVKRVDAVGAVCSGGAVHEETTSRHKSARDARTRDI